MFEIVHFLSLTRRICVENVMLLSIFAVRILKFYLYMKTNVQVKGVVARFLFIVFLFMVSFAVEAHDRRIFVWGGDINLKFTKYIVELTGKEKPRICYIPTASGDNPENIRFWSGICNALGLDTVVLNVWVSSSPENKSFEEILLNVDAIVVGGGNTLNMMGIWKAQEIDKILEKALDKGIVLSGGSAGSICWFASGISDSRPEKLSVVEGLGLLPYSNCPHYSQQERKDLYHSLIVGKEMLPGYAFDEKAGILFVNGEVEECVTQNDKHNVYFVDLDKKGHLVVEKMDTRLFIDKDALSETEYKSIEVGKRISEITSDENYTPLSAYIDIIKNNFKDNEAFLHSSVNKVFIYDDRIAGVVNDKYLDMMGFYGLWYFYNNNGKWESAGEDIGGETILESEITFREKAKVVLSKQTSKIQ